VIHRRPRLWAAAAPLALVILLVAAAPAFANTATPVTPESSNADSINHIYYAVLGVCLTIFVLVGGWLFYTSVRFRERRGDTHEPPQTHGSTRLEIGWTIVPILIIAGILVYVFMQIPDAEKISSNAMDVKVSAAQFSFSYTYPSGKPPPDASTLVLPVNRPVKLTVTSKDVAHDWWVPALGPKIDAIPGRTNYDGFTPTKVGTYTGQCAEFCGVGHAGMLITVQVVSQHTWDTNPKYSGLS
jgi:cytochrome c oxidase subunit 2